MLKDTISLGLSADAGLSGPPRGISFGIAELSELVALSTLSNASHYSYKDKGTLLYDL